MKNFIYVNLKKTSDDAVTNRFIELTRIKKVNIAIILNDVYVNNFITFFLEIEKDRRFNILIIACDRIGYDFSPGVSGSQVSALLDKHCIPHIVNPDIATLRVFEPDFIFTSNPYDMYITPDFRSDSLCAIGKVAHFSYGATLIKWEGDYQFLNNNEFLTNAWRIFVESDLIFPEKEKFVALGYLKIDSYLHYAKHPNKFNKFSIAWKPRWTAMQDSGIHEFIDFFLTIARTNDIILNFITHPMLFSALHRAGGNEHVLEMLEELKKLENVNFISGPDFLDDVLGSDVYIGDISSTLAEYCSTGNPIIFTDTHANLNQLGTSIINASYIAGNPNELELHLKSLMMNVDPKRALRENLYAEIFTYDDTISTAKRLKEYLFRHRKDATSTSPI